MSTILTLHDPQIARAYYAQGWWREDTLYSLLARHAQERPDAYALRDSRKRLTWAVLLRWVDALAARMQSIGLKTGQRVSSAFHKACVRLRSSSFCRKGSNKGARRFKLSVMVPGDRSRPCERRSSSPLADGRQ
jgi:hypothetical protein